MFRCDWCENYKDKSECREHPTEDCGNICEECADTYADEQVAALFAEMNYLTGLIYPKETANAG